MPPPVTDTLSEPGYGIPQLQASDESSPSGYYVPSNSEGVSPGIAELLQMIMQSATAESTVPQAISGLENFTLPMGPQGSESNPQQQMVAGVRRVQSGPPVSGGFPGFGSGGIAPPADIGAGPGPDSTVGQRILFALAPPHVQAQLSKRFELQRRTRAAGEVTRVMQSVYEKTRNLDFDGAREELRSAVRMAQFFPEAMSMVKDQHNFINERQQAYGRAIQFYGALESSIVMPDGNIYRNAQPHMINIYQNLKPLMTQKGAARKVSPEQDAVMADLGRLNGEDYRTMVDKLDTTWHWDDKIQEFRGINKASGRAIDAVQTPGSGREVFDPRQMRQDVPPNTLGEARRVQEQPPQQNLGAIPLGQPLPKPGERSPIAPPLVLPSGQPATPAQQPPVAPLRPAPAPGQPPLPPVPPGQTPPVINPNLAPAPGTQRIEEQQRTGQLPPSGTVLVDAQGNPISQPTAIAQARQERQEQGLPFVPGDIPQGDAYNWSLRQRIKMTRKQYAEFMNDASKTPAQKAALESQFEAGAEHWRDRNASWQAMHMHLGTAEGPYKGMTFNKFLDASDEEAAAIRRAGLQGQAQFEAEKTANTTLLNWQKQQAAKYDMVLPKMKALSVEMMRSEELGRSTAPELGARGFRVLVEMVPKYFGIGNVPAAGNAQLTDQQRFVQMMTNTVMPHLEQLLGADSPSIASIRQLLNPRNLSTLPIAIQTITQLTDVIQADRNALFAPGFGQKEGPKGEYETERAKMLERQKQFMPAPDVPGFVPQDPGGLTTPPGKQSKPPDKKSSTNQPAKYYVSNQVQQTLQQRTSPQPPQSGLTPLQTQPQPSAPVSPAAQQPTVPTMPQGLRDIGRGIAQGYNRLAGIGTPGPSGLTPPRLSAPVQFSRPPAAPQPGPTPPAAAVGIAPPTPQTQEEIRAILEQIRTENAQKRMQRR
jgi:hypothetical protein